MAWHQSDRDKTKFGHVMRDLILEMLCGKGWAVTFSQINLKQISNLLHYIQTKNVRLRSE